MTYRQRQHDRCTLRVAAAACLALLAAAGAAHEPQEALDYPGFRPESPRSGEFVTVLEDATIAVHPTMLRRSKRTAIALDSQSTIVSMLEAEGIKVVASSKRIDLERRHANSQWDLFEQNRQQFAEAVRGSVPDAQYHLVMEFLLPVSDNEIFGIECYVVDQEGNSVFSFLLNSHHKRFVEAEPSARDDSEAARNEMLARATAAGMETFLAQVSQERERVARMAAREAALVAGDFTEVVFDDFQGELPASTDRHGLRVGYISFTDGSSQLAFSTTADHPPLPTEQPGNRVLRLDLDVDHWAAFANFFAFEDAGETFWSPYDWREFDGVAFWLHGRNTGAEIFVDVIDNRGGNPAVDNAERFVYILADNFEGWRRISIPFSDFRRKWHPGDTPDDGLGLTNVHGWAIGATTTDGPVTYLVDDFSLQHVGPDAHDHAAAEYAINELPMYGNRKKTAAQLRADQEYIAFMTKDGRSRQDAAEAAAKNAWNVFYSGDKVKAIKRFNQAWLLDPDNILALWGFAVTSVDRGDYAAAARYYEMAIERGPGEPTLERDYRLTLRQLEKMRPTLVASSGD